MKEYRTVMKDYHVR